MDVPFKLENLNKMYNLHNDFFSFQQYLLHTDEHFDNRPSIGAFESLNKNENEVLLECSEDVPFSPLRQSYTPLPMNQSNGNDLDDNINVDNELHIIDIKLNDQEMLEEHDDNGNMSNKEDVVLFTISAANDGESHTEHFRLFSKNRM